MDTIDRYTVPRKVDRVKRYFFFEKKNNPRKKTNKSKNSSTIATYVLVEVYTLISFRLKLTAMVIGLLFFFSLCVFLFFPPRGAGLNDDRTEAVIREIKEGKIKNKNSPPQTSRHIYPIGLFFIHLPVPLFFS